MKKTFTALCFIMLSCAAFSQTCEQREQKLLTTLGGVSAGFVYDSYTAIGAVCDGFVHEGYSKETSITLLDVQKRLIDNIHKMMKALVDENMLKAQNDKDYIKSFIEILTGLKQQAQFFQDYLNTKTDEKKNEYETRRKDNWKKISKLMGLEE